MFRKTLVLSAVLITGLVVPQANAELFRLVPTNARQANGNFGPVLQVWRSNGGRVETFSVDRGEIPREAVVNGRTSIEWVRQRFGADPARDRIEFCPGGTLHVTCNSSDRSAQILRWP